MALMTCPDCGRANSDAAAVCLQCGRSLQPASGAARFPLFPVATHKFIVLSICSLGIYLLYWWYQNWKRISDVSSEALSPFWRTFFAPVWGFSLFGHIQDLASARGVTTRWSPTLLATLYLLVNLLWVLPSPWSLLTLAAFLPIVPVQMTSQRINASSPAGVTEDRNHRYSGLNITTIVIGGLILALAMIGAFIAP